MPAIKSTLESSSKKGKGIPAQSSSLLLTRGLDRSLRSHTANSLSAIFEKPAVKMVWEFPSQHNFYGLAPSWVEVDKAVPSYLGSKADKTLSLVIAAKREPL